MNQFTRETPGPSWAAVGTAASRPIRLLTFSTLYPNAARPTHGVFVEARLRQLVASGDATSTVLAPVPWFPLRASGFGEWARHAAAPRLEDRHGLRVLHPRYPVIPRIGMSLAPLLLYQAAVRAVGRLLAQGQAFDLIDAHYLYPDGVAAVWLGRRLGLPVVLTARGSDVSLLPRYAVPRRLIRRAIAEAAAVVAVSAGLGSNLLQLGLPPEKLTVLRNGVDLDHFRPSPDRAGLRAALELGEAPTLLSVGHLIDRKGHHHIIDALPELPGHRLLIVGEGPQRPALEARAGQRGVADRVRFLGPRPQSDLPALYTAADVLVLASSREGWANVLLEAMACGTPVVASPAWGSREAVTAPEAGLVIDAATPAAIAAGLRQLLARRPDRSATRRYAEGFSWDATTAGQLRLFRRILGP